MEQSTCLVDEEILRLEIAMQDAVIMAVCNAAQQLVHERLRTDGWTMYLQLE